MGWKILGLILSAIFVVLSVSFTALTWSGHSMGTDAATTPPIVDTPTGRYQGVVATSVFDGSSYVTYRSIPFAKPPVGDLRFKRPQPPSFRHGNPMVNSDSFQKSCWSVTKQAGDSHYGEDCLYLNVYVPGSGGLGIGPRLPVMVWIHGGGFVAGSAFPEPGRMVTRGNVIVVTVNYRLGVFGFMTTEDDDIPTNNGLWDQYMALKWVKENIQYFNGNDQSITVFGESAGGTSVGLLALSPISSGFFHKAILQSASLTLLSRDAKQRTVEFARMVGCANDTTQQSEMVACLQQVSVADILQNDLPSSFNIPIARQQLDFIWMPVIDGVFIPDEPLVLLKNRDYLQNVGAFQKDYVIGLLNNEGALVPTNFLNPIPLSDLSDAAVFKDLTEYLLYHRYGPDLNKSRDLEEAIYTFYTGCRRLASPLRPQSALDLASDVVFIVPSIEMAKALAACPSSSCLTSSTRANATICTSPSTSKVYIYHFDHCPPNRDPCDAQCMVHGSEIRLEFPSNPLPDPVDQQLSDTYVDLLTTFAQTSDPGSAVSSGWPTFDNSSRSYLSFGPYPNVRHGLVYDYRVNFWLNTASRLIRVS